MNNNDLFQAHISVELDAKNMICVLLQIISIYCKPKNHSIGKTHNPLNSKCILDCGFTATTNIVQRNTIF